MTLRPPIKGRIPPINGSTPVRLYHWNLLERQKPGIPLIKGIATLKTARITWSVWPWKDRRAESHEPHSPSARSVHAIGARGSGAHRVGSRRGRGRAAEAKSRNGPPKYFLENDRSSFILSFSSWCIQFSVVGQFASTLGSARVSQRLACLTLRELDLCRETVYES